MAMVNARAHLDARPDGVVSIGRMLTREPDWAGFLSAGLPEADHLALRAAERTGRPLGSKAFIAEVEGRTCRSFQPGKAGRARLMPTRARASLAKRSRLCLPQALGGTR